MEKAPIKPVVVLEGFTKMEDKDLDAYCKKMGLAMNKDDLKCVVDYFKEEGRDPLARSHGYHIEGYYRMCWGYGPGKDFRGGNRQVSWGTGQTCGPIPPLTPRSTHHISVPLVSRIPAVPVLEGLGVLPF